MACRIRIASLPTLRVTVACETFGKLHSNATLAATLRANGDTVEAATDALLTAPPPPPQQPQQPLPPPPPAVAPPAFVPAPPPQPAAPQSSPMSGDRDDFDFMSGGGGGDDEAGRARPDARTKAEADDTRRAAVTKADAEAEAQVDAHRGELAKAETEMLGRGGGLSAPEGAGSIAASDGMASPSGSSALGPPSAIWPSRDGGLSDDWLQLNITIAKRDKSIAKRNAIITAAKAKIRAGNQQIATHDEIIFAANATIAEHVATIAERDATIAKRDEMIAVGDGALAELRETITAMTAKHRAALQAAKQETTLDAVASSAAPSLRDNASSSRVHVDLQRMACSAPVAGAPPSEPTSPKTSGMRAALLVSVAMLFFFAFQSAQGSFVGRQARRATMGLWTSAFDSVDMDLRGNTTKAVHSVDGFVSGIMAPETHCLPEVQMLFEDPATTYTSSHASGLVAVTKQPSLAAGHGGHHALGHTKAPLAQRVRKVVTVGGGGGSCVTEGATADAFSMASRASGDPKVCTPRVRRVV